MKKPKQIVIVGAGAAGLMAGIHAAHTGATVLVLEKMKRPGRKLAITGKGRCNLTNTASIDDALEQFGTNGVFLRSAFHRFYNTDLIDFFIERGLETVVERGGRVFPASGKATDVVRVLRRELERSGAQLHCAAPVSELIVQEGQILGVQSGDARIPGDAVILATGGASYPATGSTGDGYHMAQAVGHPIIPIQPALVPLETEGDVARALAGLELRHINAQIIADGRKTADAFGDMSFTDFGVTGPVILTLSGAVVKILAAKREVFLSIDLKPALDERKLDARLQRDFTTRGKESLESVLRGLLPREMVPICLSQTGLRPTGKAADTRSDERRRLLQWLKGFRLKVSGTRPLAEAIVTAGGVRTRDVDPRTMESRIVSGLYFAGEILDVQAHTGGYNLQAAFSTAWMAARAAAAQE